MLALGIIFIVVGFILMAGSEGAGPIEAGPMAGPGALMMLFGILTVVSYAITASE